MANHEMNLAWQFIANTGVSVFLTGKAGTGKTTFLKRLSELMPKRMVVLAPTGVAAINAGGQTIHSFFQLPFGPFVPGVRRQESQDKRFAMSQTKKNLIRTLDLLVIDEISMVRADLLDQIDDVLRRHRDFRKPFGGVQLLLIGDIMQLSPVTTDADWPLLSKHYATPYFFSSHALAQLQYVTIELHHIYRQQDEHFINLLAKIRDGQVTADVIEALNSRYIPGFRPSADGWIRLTTHNQSANQYNDYFLSALPSKLVQLQAKVEGDFPAANFPADQSLALKEGAQVMFVKNDPSGNHEYFNGKIGRVVAIEEKAVFVQCDDGRRIEVTPVVWENTKYTLDPKTNEIKERVDGTFTQYPLRLAWAITVHKSQGLTFDHAVLDINYSFVHGQVYVALSRCRTLDGMVLAQPIYAQSVIVDGNVTGFIQQQSAQAAEAEQHLDEYSHAYTLSLLDDLFSFADLTGSFQSLRQTVDQLLFNKYPELAAKLRVADADLQSQVVAVAQRFGSQYHGIVSQGGYKIKDTPLAKRINEAAEYFHEKLTDILMPIIKQGAIAIDNQRTAQQYNNAFSTLKLDLSVKLSLFKALAEEPFTPNAYLTAKANALIGTQNRKAQSPKPKAQSPKSKAQSPDPQSPDPQSPKSKAQSPKSKAQSPKSKAQKPLTAQVSFDLFNSGLNIEQIAQKRGLVEGTIYGHLISFVKKGQLELDRLVAPERQRVILDVLDTFTEAFTLTQVIEKLPDGYNFNEVKAVVATRDKG